MGLLLNFNSYQDSIFIIFEKMPARMSYAKKAIAAGVLLTIVFSSSCIQIKPKQERYYHRNKHHYYHHVY